MSFITEELKTQFPNSHLLEVRPEIKRRIETHFTLTQKTVNEYMQSYYLLYWSKAHFKKCLKDGTIRHQSITYQVIYKDKILNSIPDDTQIRLSFREAIPELRLTPIVVVSL